jgi:Na+-transporting NADH:ubiquinone oxidoreductase subunit NqrF
VYKIEVYGKASKKIILSRIINNEIAQTNCMEWLILNKITIASSCNGSGVCKKCVINNNQLSCQLKLFEIANSEGQISINISYL